MSDNPKPSSDTTINTYVGPARPLPPASYWVAQGYIWWRAIGCSFGRCRRQVSADQITWVTI